MSDLARFARSASALPGSASALPGSASALPGSASALLGLASALPLCRRAADSLEPMRALSRLLWRSAARAGAGRRGLAFRDHLTVAVGDEISLPTNTLGLDAWGVRLALPHRGGDVLTARRDPAAVRRRRGLVWGDQAAAAAVGRRRGRAWGHLP